MSDKKEIDKLKKKIISKNFSVGIVGLGYVGLPICSRFVKADIKVFGVDSDQKKNTSSKERDSLYK